MKVHYVVFGILFFLAFQRVAAAQSGNPSWEEGLHWMVGPGAAVLAGLLMSVGFEYWPKFQALEARGKVAVYFLLCLGVTMGGTALAVATDVWGSWGDLQGTWWPAFWAGVAASGVGTIFHAWAPSPLKKG